MPRCLRLLANAMRAPRAPAPVAAARNVNAGATRLIAQSSSSSTTVATTSRAILPSLKPTILSSTLAPSSLPSSILSLPHSSTSTLLRTSPILPLLSITGQQPTQPSPFAQQLRFKARGTEYQPSQRVRKRRHGFLARKRTASGRKILVRRREKGRRFLSH